MYLARQLVVLESYVNKALKVDLVDGVLWLLVLARWQFNNRLRTKDRLTEYSINTE